MSRRRLAVEAAAAAAKCSHDLSQVRIYLPNNGLATRVVRRCRPACMHARPLIRPLSVSCDSTHFVHARSRLTATRRKTVDATRHPGRQSSAVAGGNRSAVRQGRQPPIACPADAREMALVVVVVAK